MIVKSYIYSTDEHKLSLLYEYDDMKKLEILQMLEHFLFFHDNGFKVVHEGSQQDLYSHL